MEARERAVRGRTKAIEAALRYRIQAGRDGDKRYVSSLLKLSGRKPVIQLVIRVSGPSDRVSVMLSASNNKAEPDTPNHRYSEFGGSNDRWNLAS